MKASRRQFLSAALIGLTPKTDRPITGSLIDDYHQLGHQLRDHAPFPAPKQTIRTPLVIVGGGIAGLSAAWRLDKRGFRDFVLLDMDLQAGGNARWGENEITAYPWAAHYVPVPGKQTLLVRELFEELGVLENGKWNERYLCFSPQERLFLYGEWQEGIEPAFGASDRDRRQMREFDERMQEFRATGEFTIPMERGAKPSRMALELDRQSMAEWLQGHGFDSPYLNWYINYACRDDYGALAAATSAWAGVHYFASREPDEKGPLTWPEGNGWIARRLIAKLGRYIRTGSMVHRIHRDRRRFHVQVGQAGGPSVEYITDFVIFAAPTFVSPYVIEGVPPVHEFQYSPWLTANLTLERWPRERGLEAAWDNVIYDSPALGYVVATHQSLRTVVDRTVWTYYWSFADGTPANNRAWLLAKDWNYWKEAILNDLSKAHPDIRACVSRIDILRLGHAMIRPAVGFLFSDERRRMAEPGENLFFANSDLSGLSLFEEAQYHGVTAAERALARLRNS